MVASGGSHCDPLSAVFAPMSFASSNRRRGWIHWRMQEIGIEEV